VITGNTSGNLGTGRIGTATVDSTYPASPLAGTVTLAYDATTTPPTLSGFPAAAAVDVTLANGSVNSYAAGVPVPYTPGASMSFNGITVSINGTPSNGDTFTIGKNTGGVSDGSNALLLGALQNQKTMGNGTATFSDAYSQLVSTVGNKAQQIQIANTAQTSLATQIRTAQQSVSGVNQDEETANLLMYQQMYQANAKVIQTASTMFDAVLGIRA
jgi:flagellar hook-associated protein 1 FlgK